jgi:hypothetical protein
MEPDPVQELIDDIVAGMYPDPRLIRERHVLTQSLNLLVFIARRTPAKHRSRSAAVMRATIKRMMRYPDA